MTARISAHELERIAAVMTPVDYAVVSMLSAAKMATGNQLRRATTGDDSPAGRRAARRQLKRLTDWRVLARLERRQGGLGRGSEAWTYALDVAGQRLAQPCTARRPHLPGRPMWAHVLAGAETYTRLVAALRGTDRMLKVWQGEPAAWRSFTGPHGETQTLKPDAYVVVTGGGYEDASFVEIDTGTQSRAVIRAKLDAYRGYAATGAEQRAADGVFPLVVFVTKREARHAVLVDLLGELPAETWRLFAVALIDDAARVLAGGAS